MDSTSTAPLGQSPDALLAPAVQAVVVAHEPGPWFDDVLAALAVQDYQRLSVTVLAAGGERLVREMVESRLPDAEVVSIDERYGYGRSVNTVLEAPDKPAFYLFCHDDVALAPDAVRLLVEESLRSNASIVGPKLVDWDRPSVLLEVGLDVDKLGHVAARAEPGELDQEQHDAVVDVFAVSAAAILVRSDLFSALGGFDATMGVTGEDIDLCWRAHVAGARVLVAPSAVGRHREGMSGRRSAVAVDRSRERHRLRTMLSNYGIVHTIRVLPQAILVSLLRALAALFTGRFGRAASFAGAWTWNLRHPRSLLKRRRELRKLRKLSDSEIRLLQVGGYAPLSTYLRGQFGADDAEGSVSARARDFVQSIRSGPSQISFAFWMFTIAVFVFGSRHLLTRRVPAVGDLVPFDLSAGDQLATFFDSWRAGGLGAEGAAPTAHGLIGVMGLVFFGAMGLLRTVLTVGLIPIGAFGVWRLLRPFDSAWIRTVGAAMYLASPVPYNALDAGSWGALVLYATLPWIVALLGRASRVAPFGPRGGSAGPGVYQSSWAREAVALGLVIALAVAVVPFAIPVVGVVVALLVLGSAVAGWPGGAARMVGVAALGVVVAAVLHLPWLLDSMLAGDRWAWFAGSRPVDQPATELSDALRLTTGTVGGGILGWALPLAAIAPLLLARGDRWAWTVRGWALYLGGVAALWADGKDWIDVALPRPEILLAPASIGLAIAAAMGAAAIQRDLRTYRLGWRQFVPLSAIAGISLALIPVIATSWTGDWGMPNTQLNRPLAQGVATEDGTSRIAWLGHDDVLAAAGRPFGDGLTLAITAGPTSSFADRWATNATGSDDLAHEAIDLALSGGTSRLGRLLAPLGISEIIVVGRLAPPPDAQLIEIVPDQVIAALSEQLDLEAIQVVPGVVRFHNTSSAGFATVLPAGSSAAVSLAEYVSDPDPVEARVLGSTGATPYVLEGRVGSSDEVYLATASGSGWSLETNGVPAERSNALGWAETFVSDQTGRATLHHRTGAGHQALMALQAALWLVALITVVRLSAGSREAET